LVFLERFYDLLALLVIGAVGIFVGGGLYPPLWRLRQVTFNGMVVIGVLILIMGYIGRRNRIRSLFWRAISKVSGVHLTRQFAADLRFMQQRAGWLCGGASVLWVASNVTGAYMLARALSLNVGPLPVGLAYVVSSILSVLPISVAGLGSREAVHILILGSVGVIKEQALLLSILDGFILPFGAIGLLMLVLVLTKNSLQRGFSESLTDVTNDTN